MNNKVQSSVFSGINNSVYSLSNLKSGDSSTLMCVEVKPRCFWIWPGVFIIQIQNHNIWILSIASWLYSLHSIFIYPHPHLDNKSMIFFNEPWELFAVIFQCYPLPWWSSLHDPLYSLFHLGSWQPLWNLSWATLFCAIVVEMGSLQSSNMELGSCLRWDFSTGHIIL